MAVDLEVLERQLLDVTDILDEEGIVYHLEGGTLLGIVREQRLLPWDHDTDISILREDLPAVERALKKVRKKGWRISLKTYEEAVDHAEIGDTRMVRIKDRKLHFIAGDNVLDFFIKTRKDGFVYWQALGNIMRVDAKYYDGFETVSWRGRELKVPVDYKGYLTEKYGDWSVPVREWNCDLEKTIVRVRQG